MATKSIDKKKTLEYAVAFYFYDSGCVNFMMGNIMYQHIKTIYDERADGRGQNTLEVAIPYTMQHRMKKYYLQGKEISEKQAKAIEAKNQKYISSNDFTLWAKCQFVTVVTK